jgi:hypothetical protein
LSPQATLADTVCFGQQRKNATGLMAGKPTMPLVNTPSNQGKKYVNLASRLHAHYLKRILTLTETLQQSVAGIESTLEKCPNTEALQQLSAGQREQLSVQLLQYGRRILDQMTEERLKIHEETCFYSRAELEKSISDLKETLAALESRESGRAAENVKGHLKKAEDMLSRLPRAPIWKKFPDEFATEEPLANLKNDFKPLHDHFSEITSHRWNGFTLKLHINPIEGIRHFETILEEKNAEQVIRFFQEASPRLRELYDEIEAQMNVRIFDNPEINDPQALHHLPENEKGEKIFKHWHYEHQRLE